MIIKIKGGAVTSAEYAVISKGVSRLTFNTLERWHMWDSVGWDSCSGVNLPRTLQFNWHEEDTNNPSPSGTLTLHAETSIEYDEITRLRYTLHEKEQIEIMFINEGLL